MDFTKDSYEFNTLAIVGNGFDLYHGYHTSFYDFIQKTEHPSLDIFKKLCENINAIKTWYCFEENINVLTKKLFEQRISDGDYGVGATIDKAFNDIHILLIEYLMREISSKKLTKNSMIEQYLNNKTITFNFNYTNTVETYTPNVFYVHGSLDENDIILGYDYRDEPCLAEFNEMHWSKIISRKKLAFRRFLRQCMGFKTDSEEFKSLTKGLESYLTIENSAKGICNDDIANIENGEWIAEVIKEIESQPIPDICYNKINSIVVLGHGIEADKVLLETIILNCSNLKEVVIFRYDEESDGSIEKKRAFFLEYCNNIKIVQY